MLARSQNRPFCCQHRPRPAAERWQEQGNELEGIQEGLSPGVLGEVSELATGLNPNAVSTDQQCRMEGTGNAYTKSVLEG